MPFPVIRPLLTHLHQLDTLRLLPGVGSLADPRPPMVRPRSKALPRVLLVLLLAFVAAHAAAQSQLEQMHDLLDRGYYNSAARVVGPSLVESEPQNPDAYLLYSRSLHLVGETAAARSAFERAAQLAGAASDEDARFDHLDGLLNAAEGNLGRSVDLLRSAFEKSGGYEYGMDWGRIAWQAYRLDEAIEAYQAVSETEEGASSPWPHLNRGRILAFLDRHDEAVAAYRTAIEVFEQHDTGEARPSPAYVEAFFRLGQIYEEMGSVEGSDRFLQLALDHYRAALTGDPNYAPAIDALDSLSRRLP